VRSALEYDDTGYASHMLFFRFLDFDLGKNMRLHRRRFLGLAVSIVASPNSSSAATAQAYPNGVVKIVLGSTAGGGTDIIARLMGQWLSQRFSQSFIVDDRPGAGSNIATEAVVRAAPDGQTLLLVTTANAINATLYDKLAFDFMRDIEPISGIARVPLVMVVNPAFPAKTVPEFIAYARTHPGTINMATGGIGGSPYVAGVLFKLMTGINLTLVPYRGLALALTDLLGGQVQALFSSLPAAGEFIKTDKIRALAVTTAVRAPSHPDIPTIDEFVPGFEASQWYGLGAPRNTPSEIIDTLNKEINAGLADQKLRSQLANLGGTVLESTPSEFRKFVASETEKWRKVIKLSGAKAR
jgi:tripartite-type tricarboxylate transporter receptor subunit TctC